MPYYYIDLIKILVDVTKFNAQLITAPHESIKKCSNQTIQAYPFECLQPHMS